MLETTRETEFLAGVEMKHVGESIFLDKTVQCGENDATVSQTALRPEG